MPPRQPLLTTVSDAPDDVHPLRLPVSNPPLVSPLAWDDVMVSAIAVVCEPLGALPVTVRVYVPGAAVPVSIVSVELLPAVTEAGLKLALAPAGSPDSVRATVSADPLV